MERQQAIEYLRSMMPDYLRKLGLPTEKNFKCLTGTHQDNTPSMSFDKKDGKHVKCFSCGEYLDIFDLIGIYNNTNDFNRQLEILSDLFNVKVEKGTYNAVEPNIKTVKHQPTLEHQTDIKSPVKASESVITDDDIKHKDFITASRENYHKTNYLRSRGISDHTAERFNIGYANNYPLGNNKYMNAVIIPTSEYSYTARNTDITSNERIRKRGDTPVFNVEALYNGLKPVLIVEGEIDVLSVIEAGGEAVGLGSKGTYNKLVEELKNGNADKVKSPIIIALDNEKETYTNAQKLQEELKPFKLETYIYNPYGNSKDANEALTSDRQAFINEMQAFKDNETARKHLYKQEHSSIRYLQDFINGISERANTPAISTGFNSLDKVLDGGLYEGLYILGAVSSLGKTTLIMQIADQIATAGQDVLIFSLEMARSEIIAKSISRNTFLLECKKELPNVEHMKTVRGITSADRYPKYNEEERQLISNAINLYHEYAGNIIIDEGVGDISVDTVRDRVQKHIKATGNKPVVFIDYLQILAPYEVRASDKQNTDKAVLELKRISRDYKIPVIGISSLNRDNYKNKINMTAFKESGAIEYTSDVLLGLQYKGAGENSFDVSRAMKGQNGKREIELHVLKNRNGRTGDILNFDYYTLFNIFQEVN